MSDLLIENWEVIFYLIPFVLTYFIYRFSYHKQGNKQKAIYKTITLSTLFFIIGTLLIIHSMFVSYFIGYILIVFLFLFGFILILICNSFILFIIHSIFFSYFNVYILICFLLLLRFILILQWKYYNEVILLKGVKIVWRFSFLIFLASYLILIIFNLSKFIYKTYF